MILYHNGTKWGLWPFFVPLSFDGIDYFCAAIYNRLKRCHYALLAGTTDGKGAIMDMQNLNDDAICVEMGKRLKSLRLRKNLTQEDVARLTRLSLNPIKSLEQGQGKLSTIIAVMRAFGVLDALDSFIPEAPVSPIQIAKMHGKKRQRGSGRRISKEPVMESKW